MSDITFSTPILFIIYKRPDLTFEVFKKIKEVKPKRLYIAADGPKCNYNEDIAIIHQARSVINHIDWDCDLKIRFQHNNQGCKCHVSGAISWFFDHEEEGIILEDDCLPNSGFFMFCSQMLEKYRYDHTVGHIGGNNFMEGEIISNTYSFSKYSFVWGWASWRRVWQLFDINIETFPQTLKLNKFKTYFNSRFEEYTFYNKFLQVYHHQIDTWDYQWLYTMWENNLKSIVPPVNLVKNIGFDKRATHTQKINWISRLPHGNIKEVEPPDLNVIDNKADIIYYNKLFKRIFLSNIYLKFKLSFYKLKYYGKPVKKRTTSGIVPVPYEQIQRVG